MEALKLGQNVKVAFVIGSKVEEGKTEKRFTATCSCGSMVHAAKKESSLHHLLEKHAGCCGSKYQLTGEKTFNGSKIEEEVKMTMALAIIPQTTTALMVLPVANPETSQAVQEASKPVLIDVTHLITRGRKGITNAQMIPAFRAIFESGIQVEEKLNILFTNFEKEFVSSTKYVPDHMKLVLEQFLQTKPGYTNHQVRTGKKVRQAK